VVLFVYNEPLRLNRVAVFSGVADPDVIQQGVR
jgi:hypothetical protein